MEIPNAPPDVKKHQEIDAQFAAWWRFLNTLGMFSFLLFLACAGLGDARHTSALISFSLVCWIYWKGKMHFPKFIISLRNDKMSASCLFEKTLWREHFNKKLLHYFPMIIGMFLLLGLAVVPIFAKNFAKSIQLYFSFFKLFCP